MKLTLVAISFILVLTHVLWDYLSGGVPVHHVLADGDLPGISNWWGLVSIPILTWVLFSFLERKKNFSSFNDFNSNGVFLAFVLSLSFGILNSVLWNLGYDHALQYLIILPILLSLFIKVHRPECVLGFVLGMMYTFGGVLPIIFSFVLLVLSFITYHIIHRGLLYLVTKFTV